jgi:hypothetical protein
MKRLVLEGWILLLHRLHVGSLAPEADPHNILLDTVSYYDDTEPSWNERHYFTVTEAHRGQVGLHVNVSVSRRSFQPAASSSGEIFYRWPGFDKESWEHEQRLYEQLQPYGYRIFLSGIGGDELLGGVPTPIPELSDTLAAGNLVRLFRKATQWCIKASAAEESNRGRDRCRLQRQQAASDSEASIGARSSDPQLLVAGRRFARSVCWQRKLLRNGGAHASQIYWNRIGRKVLRRGKRKIESGSSEDRAQAIL